MLTTAIGYGKSRRQSAVNSAPPPQVPELGSVRPARRFAVASLTAMVMVRRTAPVSSVAYITEPASVLCARPRAVTNPWVLDALSALTRPASPAVSRATGFWGALGGVGKGVPHSSRPGDGLNWATHRWSVSLGVLLRHVSRPTGFRNNRSVILGPDRAMMYVVPAWTGCGTASLQVWPGLACRPRCPGSWPATAIFA